MHEEYFIKDHLGNIRVRFEDADQDGEIQYEFPVENPVMIQNKVESMYMDKIRKAAADYHKMKGGN